MPRNRCAAVCLEQSRLSRRGFFAAASVAALPLVNCWSAPARSGAVRKVEQKGPASRYVPTVKATFVRRKGDYGMWWPGAVYDGEAARRQYTTELASAAKQLNIKLDLRPQPIYSRGEADAWIAQAAQAKPDGLVVMLLDRQRHAWPTANKAIDTKIPTVVFTPLGTSFTTNTAAPSRKAGCFICSTDDFSQAVYGLKMLKAAAKLRRTRCIVLRGSKRRDTQMPDLGIQLRYVPANSFIDEYRNTPVDDEIRTIAADYQKRARKRIGATEQDVLNGVKSYVVARKILERDQGDAITMDCLGALGPTDISLPCIAWSKMNDDGVPAACEADLGAVATHAIVQYLFDRPGFQQDPVAETVQQAIIGSHCTCATRLNGFDQPPEPFDLRHHHGQRDAVPRTIWRVGQRITSADVLPGSKPGQTRMIISAGEVIDNVSVPPAGGCVVAVMVRFDGVTDVLTYPGFHHIFFYGDYKRELVQFCHLLGIQPQVV